MHRLIVFFFFLETFLLGNFSSCRYPKIEWKKGCMYEDAETYLNPTASITYNELPSQQAYSWSNVQPATLFVAHQFDGTPNEAVKSMSVVSLSFTPSTCLNSGGGAAFSTTPFSLLDESNTAASPNNGWKLHWTNTDASGKRTANFEACTSATFVVRAKHNDNSYSDCSVNMVLGDVNDQPTFDELNNNALLTTGPSYGRVYDQTSATNQYLTPRAIEERQPRNTVVGSAITVTDDDVANGQELEYSIVVVNDKNGVNTDGFFRISKCSGQIYLAKDGIDYAAAHGDRFSDSGMYQLTIKIQDDGEFFADANLAQENYALLYINVIDINDPPFLGAQLDLKIGEASTSSSAKVINSPVPASDPDVTTGIESTSLWSLDLVSSEVFQIDASSGDITVAVGQSLNYESIESYTIIVTLSDGRAPLPLTDTKTYIISVNDENDRPIFSNVGGSTFTFPEYTANNNQATTGSVSLFSMAVSDEDPGSVVTFSNDPSNPGTGDMFFEAEKSSGGFSYKLKIKNSATVANLDFETTSSYQLKLRVTDNGRISTGIVGVQFRYVRHLLVVHVDTTPSIPFEYLYEYRAT